MQAQWFLAVPQREKRILELEVDALGNVTEADEANQYRTAFTMCWPADLVRSLKLRPSHTDPCTLTPYSSSEITPN